MSATHGFVFDDEPIESILYGEEGVGPTPADLFADVRSELSEVAACFKREETDDGLRRMRAVLESGHALQARDLLVCTALLGTLIPTVPCPILPQTAVPCDALLERIVASSLALEAAQIADTAGFLLFRWHEGAGRYADALRVAEMLLDLAKRGSNRSHEAVIMNNLAYEHYLKGAWQQSEEWFERALALFVACRDTFEIANARANLLLVRFAAAGGKPGAEMEEELREIMPAMAKDWRRRKPLLLLARIAEARGDLEGAIDMASQAVGAGVGVLTRHHREDVLYMAELERRQSVSALPVSGDT